MPTHSRRGHARKELAGVFLRDESLLHLRNRCSVPFASNGLLIALAAWGGCVRLHQSNEEDDNCESQ
jgi:hypothetical protein